MLADECFPARNLRFATDESVPRHWHGGRRAVTIFFDNLSLFFPAGERFFVAAVNHYKPRVDDPRLAAEVTAFCAQEGFHSREHVRYNRMLEAQGYPASALERRVERILKFVARVLPWRARLSVTCALEHFTATLAHGLLGDRALLDGAHPTMAALWRWHAAEENEHKAVAWDVYARVGGRWPERALVMLLATIIFWALVIDQQARLMRTDGILWSLSEWRALLRFLWIEPGGLRKMWRHYLDYYRFDFHPWQLDNRALLADWQRELAASPVYRGAGA
jgi:predicted metal-dependent hydrolase